MVKQISFEEVRKHNDSKSVWMVIHDDVYDVTAFLNEHPGGADSLLDEAGKDASTAFEDVGHSDDARQLLTKYKIGTLPPGEKGSSFKECSKLKWALLALAGAIIIGIVIKKYSSGSS